MPLSKKNLTLKGALEMPLNFRERQSVIKELANQYIQLSKKRFAFIPKPPGNNFRHTPCVTIVETAPPHWPLRQKPH